jgi:beta-xylosidase
MKPDAVSTFHGTRAASNRSGGGAGNPVLPVHAADPHLVIVGDRYWLYCTDGGLYASAAAFDAGRPGPGGPGFAAWSSSDLVHWQSHGQVLSFTRDVSWARGNDWAPAMVQHNGRCYLYFCSDSSIGVAVADTPAGPFHDALGHALVEHRPDCSAIDPMVFVDDDGRPYLHFGAVPGYWLEGRVPLAMSLSVRELNADMMSFAGPEHPTIPVMRRDGEKWSNLHHIEAAFAFKRKAVYYLMWSQGSCTSADEADAYRVNYATSGSPLGPWRIAAEHNPVLQSRREVDCLAPGHHSVIRIPGTDAWYCAYHCNDGRHAGVPGAVAQRRVCIDTMTFAADGSIQPIIPTRHGPGPRKLIGAAAGC